MVWLSVSYLAIEAILGVPHLTSAWTWRFGVVYQLSEHIEFFEDERSSRNTASCVCSDVNDHTLSRQMKGRDGLPVKT